VLKQAASGVPFAGKTVVCIITGSGLKDPETALQTDPAMHHVPADLDAIEREMGW
jgi:threonine synthase